MEEEKPKERRIAVINEVHSVGFRIIAWMLSQIGYEVHCADDSFIGVVPLHHSSHSHPSSLCKGQMSLDQMNSETLYVDTHPDAVKALRKKRRLGPILLVWQMPVGPEWVRENFAPCRRVGSLGWSTSVGREIARMGVCPNDHFWPPYHGPLDQTQRTGVGDYLITVVENAAGWSNVGVLENLRDQPRARLQLFGGGPPTWSQKIPQPRLFARIRESLAMYHLKPFDTPGLAVMEAALQGVPIIFPHDWVRLTASEDLFEHGKSCLIVPTEVPLVLEAAEMLRDPETNRVIGGEGRKRLLAATDWTTNSRRLSQLLDAINRT